MITDMLLVLITLAAAFFVGYTAGVHKTCDRVSDILVGANNMLKMEHVTKQGCLKFMGRLHSSLNGMSRYQPASAKREMIQYLASDEIHEDELEVVTT